MWCYSSASFTLNFDFLNLAIIDGFSIQINNNVEVVYLLLGYPVHSRLWQNGYPVLFFWDNVGNSASILTILLLLQAEIYGA